MLTVRRHKPTQRIRATIVAPDGTRAATRTISDPSHSATQPKLAVAPDGTAVAAWAWHDRGGWRVQAAVRRPGQPRFDRPAERLAAGEPPEPLALARRRRGRRRAEPR